MNRTTSVIGVVLCVLLALSCSGGGDPTSPVFQPDGDLTACWGASEGGPQTHLWGLFTVYVDIENQTATAVLNRQAMFTVNVVNFLNGNPMSMTFKINSTPVGPDYVDVDIDVSLTHPFPGLPQYHGYDVRGVFMGDGSAVMAYNSDLIYPVPGTDQFMLPDPVDGYGGPDGYTRWFNYSEFTTGGMPLFSYTPGKAATPGFAGTATLNPYKYFADGLATTENLWDWLVSHPEYRGQFSSGATNDRNYYIRFPHPKQVTYGYAVLANWEGTEDENHPSNAPEAVGCEVVDHSNVYYVDPSNNGGSLKLDISVFDWSSEVSAGVMEDYKLFLESTVLSSAYEFGGDDMTPVGGNETYSTYHVEIPADDVKHLEGNEYWVIVENPDHDYTNEFGVINGAWEDPLAAFFRYGLHVSAQQECTDPIVESMAPDTAVYNDFLDDAKILGDEMEDGLYLACYLTNGSIDVVGEEVAWQSAQEVTADFDLEAYGAVVGMYDLYFTDGDGCQVVLQDAIELTECPDPFYFTSFEASEVDPYGTPESENWSRYSVHGGHPTPPPDYWSCEWFEGHLNCREATCSHFGQPCGGSLNAAASAFTWRTYGIQIPECWGDETIEMTLVFDYDATCLDFRNRFRAEYSDDGENWVILFSYDAPYNYTTTAIYWFLDWPMTTAHFNFDDKGPFYWGWSNEKVYDKNSLEFSGGDTVWIRLFSYGALYFCCSNNTPGWTAHEMKLGSPE